MQVVLVEQLRQLLIILEQVWHWLLLTMYKLEVQVKQVPFIEQDSQLLKLVHKLQDPKVV